MCLDASPHIHICIVAQFRRAAHYAILRHRNVTTAKHFIRFCVGFRRCLCPSFIFINALLSGACGFWSLCGDIGRQVVTFGYAFLGTMRTFHRAMPLSTDSTEQTNNATAAATASVVVCPISVFIWSAFYIWNRTHARAGSPFRSLHKRTAVNDVWPGATYKPGVLPPPVHCAPTWSEHVSGVCGIPELYAQSPNIEIVRMCLCVCIFSDCGAGVQSQSE